jgi:ATP-binding cassette subfamily B (MDR/TAP) protein 1
MPVPWFDKPRNSSGSLSARLALDSQKVNKLTTIYISILVENSMSLISGVIIAFFYEWRTSLVAFGLLPFMIIAGVCQNYFANGFSAQTDKAYQDSSNLITEAMINIRTVTSFGYADMLERKYSECLKDPYLSGVKIAHIAGLMYGVSMAILFVAFALLFHFGTIFLRDNGLSV